MGGKGTLCYFKDKLAVLSENWKKLKDSLITHMKVVIKIYKLFDPANSVSGNLTQINHQKGYKYEAITVLKIPSEKAKDMKEITVH